MFCKCACGGDIQISTLNKLYQKVSVIQHSERETGYLAKLESSIQLIKVLYCHCMVSQVTSFLKN